jgi:hypothetical protein
MNPFEITLAEAGCSIRKATEAELKDDGVSAVEPPTANRGSRACGPKSHQLP